MKYLKKIEYLVLNLLAKEVNKGNLFISKNKLLGELDVVNPNYSYSKYNMSKVANYTTISNYSISDFFDTTDGVLKNNLSSALKNLEDKSLIFYNEVMTVSIAKTNAQINKNNDLVLNRKVKKLNGKRFVSFDIANTTVDSEVRRATNQEISDILRVRNDVLGEYGYEKVSDAFKSGKSKEFYSRVGDLLFKDYNIDMFYMSYEIFFNHDHVQKERKKLEDWAIEESKRILSVIDLNEDVIDRLKDNLNRRIDKSEELFLETDKEEYAFRMTDAYRDEQIALMSLMITFGADILELDIANQFEDK